LKLVNVESKLCRNPQVVYRVLTQDEGGVLLHLESGEYHGVNQVGFVIWELTDGARTVREIVDAVRERVENPPPHLESDVIRFLTGLEERGLVV
jgi:hypothetical protein